VPTEFIEISSSELKLSSISKLPPKVLSDQVLSFLKDFGGVNFTTENVGICIDVAKFYDDPVPSDFLLYEKTDHAKRVQLSEYLPLEVQDSEKDTQTRWFYDR
jgi:hypothetical protein